MTEPVVPPAAPLPPVKEPAAASKKSGAKRILYGILAAFTTPEAIKAEKSLAATVLTRLAITVAGAVPFRSVVLVKVLGSDDLTVSPKLLFLVVAAICFAIALLGAVNVLHGVNQAAWDDGGFP